MERFEFDNFDPAESVRRRANDLLAKVSDQAPGDAHVTGYMELDGETYHCVIEIFSPTLPFAVSMAARFPAIALDRAEFAILRKLAKWRTARYSQAGTEAAAS